METERKSVNWFFASKETFYETIRNSFEQVVAVNGRREAEDVCP